MEVCQRAKPRIHDLQVGQLVRLMEKLGRKAKIVGLLALILLDLDHQGVEGGREEAGGERHQRVSPQGKRSQ